VIIRLESERIAVHHSGRSRPGIGQRASALVEHTWNSSSDHLTTS